MIVSDRRKLSAYAKRIRDLDVGDYAQNLITRKRGLVTDAEPDWVTVTYLDGCYDTLPKAAFRKLRGKHKDGGHDLDVKRRK